PDRSVRSAEADEPVDLGDRIRRRLEGGPGDGADGGGAPGDFDDMLVGFRAEAAETSGEADPDAHVELGVALRQMGLVDDAIREFQVAARAPDPPVRAFELLGECFLEKDLHSVAVRVLNRALRLPGHPDHELLGVLYQLGVAYQVVEEHEEALDCFERVFSVDVDFRDVAERMEEARTRV
ncbi:MAG: tetratricopeptide repeat protein, partial [Gemmatimonadota bacterium]